MKYNLIQCFYINLANYLITGIFNEYNLELIKTYMIVKHHFSGELSSNIGEFHKIILLKDGISILCYKLDDLLTDNYLQIKKIIFNSTNSEYLINDYLNSDETKKNSIK